VAGLSELDGVTPPEHLFTWVDADEHLALLATADEWPDWLAAADGWWDALELVVAPGTTADQVAQWLEEVFGRGSTAWRDGSLMLRLDDPRTTEFTGLPVVITVEQPRKSRAACPCCARSTSLPTCPNRWHALARRAFPTISRFSLFTPSREDAAEPCTPSLPLTLPHDTAPAFC
jgi:hypothetical protein